MALRTYAIEPFSLGADCPHASLEDGIPIVLEEHKRLQIQCLIDDGDGSAPAGLPDGEWRLYCAGTDDAEPTHIEQAETGELSLADIAPGGDGALVNAYANFTDTPGARAWLYYERATGTATCTIHITVS